MLKRIHPVAGVLALLTILTFWVSTVVTEALGATAAIVAVKTAIPWGLLVLIPALAAAGGSGLALARGGAGSEPGGERGTLLGLKRRRMPVIAANGVLILIPCAFYLAFKAQAGELDRAFALVQAVELLAGAVNVALLLLNLRDGLRMRSVTRG